MARLEQRIKDLEKEVPQGQVHPPGKRSVVFEPIRSFKRYGFDLERLNPPPRRKPTLDKSGHVQFSPFTDEEKAEIYAREKLRESLKGLDRDTQRKLAAQHGYRVIYPDKSDSHTCAMT
jgi:hypothetical protein